MKCPDKYRYMLVKLGLKTGSVCRSLSPCDKGFAQWLINGVPPEDTLSDHLMAIAQDKYNSLQRTLTDDL